MRLLIVEDVRVMADSIARSLKREGLAVDVAYDGATALDLAGHNSYEVVVLDRDLPGVHGDDVCRQLTGGAARILMLTASGTVDDRVDGLTLGADDYLAKPFALAELVARIRALGRRAGRAVAPVLTAGDITLDPSRRQATRADQPLCLTNKEFGVLEVLLAADGAVISAEELLERVWDAHADPFTNTVRVTIANLRRKLGDPPAIETVIGAGYLIPRVVTFRTRIRPSVRLRLTLIYSGLFVLAGGALLSANYFLVSHREHRSGTAVSIVCNPGVAPALVSGAPDPAAVGASLSGGCSKVQVSGSSASGLHLNGPNVAYQGAGPVAQQSPVSKSGLAALATLATRAQDHTLHTLEVESALALGVMAVASLGLGWLVAGRVLRPVHHITDTARRLSEETLHERINLDGPDDELKELADTFDAMLARLDRAFAGQRRFVANASHELRTPLATERVLIDEALANREAGSDELRSILTDLRVNNEQTERLIDALLILARSARGVHRFVRVDLASVARQGVQQAQAEAVTAGIEIRTHLTPAPASGDPALLERVVGNLVENGIRHNRPSGWLEVETDVWRGRPRLVVANSGRVLDPDGVPALFEPFHREGADRVATGSGFGLGLSIVQSVIEAHGGRVDAAALPEGGLRVVVILRAPSPMPEPPPAGRAAGHADTSSRPAAGTGSLSCRARTA